MNDSTSADITERHGALKAILAIQFMALLIGLAMPITPSKTGSDFSVAEWFFENPTYVQEVLVYFLLTNALIALLGAIAWLWIRIDRWRKK